MDAAHVAAVAVRHFDWTPDDAAAAPREPDGVAELLAAYAPLRAAKALEQESGYAVALEASQHF